MTSLLKSIALSGVLLAGVASLPVASAPGSGDAALAPLGLIAQSGLTDVEPVRWRPRHVRCHWERRCWWSRWHGRQCRAVRVCHRPRWWW